MRWMAVLGGFLSVLVFGACTTTEERPEPPPSPWPAWVGEAKLVPDPLLEEAARQVCARELEILDEGLRSELGIIDGQLLMVRGAAAPAQLKALLKDPALTHMGAVSVGGPCRAAVVSRRLVSPQGEIPTKLQNPGAVELKLATASEGAATLFISRPDGAVVRTELAPGPIATTLDLDIEGRYRAEVLLTIPGEGPVVAALWPIDVGLPKSTPPMPEVLFPDEGNSDLALTFRLSALVHRLRTEQELYPVKVAPQLEAAAKSRAESLAQSGKLGHLVPNEESAAEALAATGVTWKVARLSELQAQASTLREAWGALLSSPAHRFELTWPESSHAGVAVARGQDAAGRPLVSVVVLMARKVSETPVPAAKNNLLAKFNIARDQKGRTPLRLDDELARYAQEQADAMAKAGTTDDGLLGSPVAEMALEGDASLEIVRSVLAAVDDPMRLPASNATLAKEARRVGIGMVSGTAAGRWYICVLAAR